MSDMYTHANKINAQLKQVGMTEAQLNIILELARVAKFRCQSNKAFTNFVNAVLDGTNTKLESYEVKLESGKSFDAFRIVGNVEPKGLELTV